MQFFVIQSRRFADYDDWQLHLFGIVTKAWELDEMAFSTTVIATSVLGGTFYDVDTGIYHDQTTTLRITLSTVISMAVLADVSQYVFWECNYEENEQICDNRTLYHLAPVAFLTVLMASG